MNTETIFSHRPLAGVSVGARKVNNILYVAVAIVNDGTSRNGLFWEDRQDIFCRSTARQIINGRIDNAVKSGVQSDNLSVFSFVTDTSARQFMAEFRKTFKPTNDETDDFLVNTLSFGDDEEETENNFDIEVRFRPTASDLLARIQSLAFEVINESASV